MKYFINCKNKKGEDKHFEVPEEISIYIRQLECCILCPKQSKLKEVYKDRFHSRNKSGCVV